MAQTLPKPDPQIYQIAMDLLQTANRLETGVTPESQNKIVAIVYLQALLREKVE